MKQSLHLRLGQQLTMTPQLQQAIKLLQMSTLDLQQEIQQALESNIMLEINDEESSPREAATTPEKKIENSDSFTSEGSQTNIPDELPSILHGKIFMKALWLPALITPRLLSLNLSVVTHRHCWTTCYGNWN
jgi:DNA-directed RNA polymerase specialized sigma54-like protein